MICDLDDFHEHNHRYDLLLALKEANPAFRCTLFAVPGLGSEHFWANVPEWCQLAVHGWIHPSPMECHDWTHERMRRLIREPIVEEFFVKGWKSPGWMSSAGVYQALLDEGWWVADQHLADAVRPPELPVYLYEDSPDRWHGHIQNVCGNGLEETWEVLLERVRAATEFQWCSEALSVGPHPYDPGAGGVPEGVPRVGGGADREAA